MIVIESGGKNFEGSQLYGKEVFTFEICKNHVLKF